MVSQMISDCERLIKITPQFIKTTPQIAGNREGLHSRCVRSSITIKNRVSEHNIKKDCEHGLHHHGRFFISQFAIAIEKIEAD